MATIEELQKAIDDKSFAPENLTGEQRAAVDSLIEEGILKGPATGDIMQQRDVARQEVAQQKTEALQPFTAATGIERSDVEMVGEVALGITPFLQDREKLVKEIIGTPGQQGGIYGVNQQKINALAARGYQFDKVEKLLKNLPVIRGVGMLRKTAATVGKVADGFRQLAKAGPSQLLATEAKSIGLATAGAGAGSLAYDAANFTTDFAVNSQEDLARIKDDDLEGMGPTERAAYNAMEAMSNSAMFNAGAFALGPLMSLAKSGYRSIVGLKGAKQEELARFARETNVPVNKMALIDENASFLARGTKNILNTLGIFPAVAGPGARNKLKIEQKTFDAMLDHLDAGAPYSHAELLGFGALQQMKNNFKQFMNSVAVQYDMVMRKAQRFGDIKIVPTTNLKQAMERIETELKSNYPDFAKYLDNDLSEVTELGDPLIRFLRTARNNMYYDDMLTPGQYVGLTKMMTNAYSMSKIGDPRGMIRTLDDALKLDFNSVANADNIQNVLKTRSMKEAYDSTLEQQGQEAANQFVKDKITELNAVNDELLRANLFFTDNIRPFQKGPVTKQVRQVDANLFTNLGLQGIVGNSSILPDQYWSKAIKNIFRTGSGKSIENLQYQLGYNKGGTGKEIFDRFKSLYMFDAFQQAYKSKPQFTDDPIFDLMEKGKNKGVIKDYVDEMERTAGREFRQGQFIDPDEYVRSGLGTKKFADMKYASDAVAQFDPEIFARNLGLRGAPDEVAAARDKLIQMYGGGAKGKRGLEYLEKMIALMEANASYDIGDTSRFLKRRMMLGGLSSAAGGVIPLAAGSAAVGPLPMIGFVLVARTAGDILTDPKAVEDMYKYLDNAFKYDELSKKGKLSTARLFASLYNNALDEKKDKPEIDPNLINAQEIQEYLLGLPSQRPITFMDLDGFIPQEKKRMFPQTFTLPRTPAASLAAGENFLKGAAVAKENENMISTAFAVSDIQEERAQAQPVAQPVAQPQAPVQPQQQAQTYGALFPQDELGQAIAERSNG